MLDHRIHTFLKLCDLMNYRKTAEALHMTQPAVTQHIQYIEAEYHCKLFDYNGRILSQTPTCRKLESHLRGLLYNETRFREDLHPSPTIKLSIGATKTIGDYTLEPTILSLLRRDDLELELLIDNTDNLLTKLDAMELDLLLVEGFFDKDRYASQFIKQEELVGICAPDHPFAGRAVPLEDLFQEAILLREDGSGTRAVLEQFLYEHGYSTHRFRKTARISSFKLIQTAVMEGNAISFVYESIAKANPNLGVFRVAHASIFHEFNYVFLPNTSMEPFVALLSEAGVAALSEPFRGGSFPSEPSRPLSF